MGYIKEKIIEAEVDKVIDNELEIRIEKFKGGLSDEEEKKLSDLIDCQIEDMKFKRDEQRDEKER